MSVSSPETGFYHHPDHNTSLRLVFCLLRNLHKTRKKTIGMYRGERVKKRNRKIAIGMCRSSEVHHRDGLSLSTGRIHGILQVLKHLQKTVVLALECRVAGLLVSKEKNNNNKKQQVSYDTSKAHRIRPCFKTNDILYLEFHDFLGQRFHLGSQLLGIMGG